MRTKETINDGWKFALCRGRDPKLNEQIPDEDAFLPVMLPHDWAIEAAFSKTMDQGLAQGFFDRWGVGWYRRSMDVKKEDGKRYYLCFDGIFEDSTVWVNQKKAGGRKYGYSSFELDITDSLKNGENELLVRVNNTSFPADRWYSGAGIYRKVTFVSVPEMHFEHRKIKIKTVQNSDKSADLYIETGLEHEPGVILTAVLSKNEDRYISKMRKNGEDIVIHVPDCSLWSAQNPQLYDLTLQLKNERKNAEEVLDEISMEIGFRDVKLDAEHGLFVNGESVKLKGVCLHQDIGCFGTAVTKELWRERLKKLKEIGCNALRLAHHLYFPEMLELCDEMGFYVFEECFDKWTGGAYGRYYQTEWKRDIEEMVLRDRNHACILFWGIGNEVENQAYPSMLEHLKEHVALVKTMDQRPVSLALNPHLTYPGEEVDLTKVKDIQQFVDETKEGEIYRIEDRVIQTKKMADCVDLLCCNYQEQWYEALHKAIPDKVILGTETYMYFRREERMESGTLVEQNPWQAVEAYDYCIGGMIWTGIDYWGESMEYPSKGWSGALFSTDMEKRQPAWLMQCYWTSEPVIHFDVMDMSLPDEGVKEAWAAPAYVSHWEFPQVTRAVIPFVITTNCEDVVLILEKKEYALKHPDEDNKYLWRGFLPYQAGKVTAIGKNQGKEVCRYEINTPGPAAVLKFEQEEREISLPADGSVYRLYEKVRAFDKELRPVFHESAGVQFVIEGPAKIAGTINGDIKNSEPCTEDRVHLYRGKAAVGLELSQEGRVKLYAFAGGMEPAVMILNVKKGE